MNKQIAEDYVSYEIAVLLKEKGFDESVNRFYEISTGKPLLVRSEYCRNSFTIDYAAPTHQMALKWLREVHSIYITSEPDINDKHCFYPVIYTMTEESWDIQYFEELEKLSFDKPEQAVEAALKYTLENLI